MTDMKKYAQYRFGSHVGQRNGADGLVNTQSAKVRKAYEDQYSSVVHDLKAHKNGGEPCTADWIKAM